MYQAGAVNGSKRVTQHDTDGNRFVGAQGSVLTHQIGEGAPADELHDQAKLPVLTLNAEHPDDVLMADAREQLAFAQPRVVTAAEKPACIDDLQGDVELEIRVPGTVDDAKAATANLLEKGVATPRRSGSGQSAYVRQCLIELGSRPFR